MYQGPAIIYAGGGEGNGGHGSAKINATPSADKGFSLVRILVVKMSSEGHHSGTIEILLTRNRL